MTRTASSVRARRSSTGEDRPDRARASSTTDGPPPAPASREVWTAGVVLLLTAAALVWLGRDQWFFLDEFDFVVDRRLGSVEDLLRPHNEHLSLIPALVLPALFSAFGLTTYAPYYVVLVALHLVTVALAYTIMRRQQVPLLPALMGALVLMTYAAGAQNILWANQIGLIGSLAAFLAAVLVLSGGRSSTRRCLAAAVLLAVSLASSGVGVAALVGATAFLLVTRQDLRALLLTIGPPAVMYAAWSAAYGRSAGGADSLGLLASADRAPLFMLRAAGHALDGFVLGGLAPADGPGLLLVALFLLGCGAALQKLGMAVPPVVVACVAMTAALYASTALLRVGLDPELALAGRYAYLGAFLLLPAALGLMARTLTGWTATAATMSALFLLLSCLPFNVAFLRSQAAEQAAYETALRDRIAAAGVLVASGTDVVESSPVDARLAPAFDVGELARLQREGRLPPVTPDVSDGDRAAALTMISAHLRPGPAPAPAAPLLTPVRDVAAGTVTRDGGCLSASGSGGDATGFLVFEYSAGGTVVVRPAVADVVRLYVGPAPDFQLGGFVDTAVPAGAELSLELAAPDQDRYLRVEAPGPFTVCGLIA